MDDKDYTIYKLTKDEEAVIIDYRKLQLVKFKHDCLWLNRHDKCTIYNRKYKKYEDCKCNEYNCIECKKYEKYEE